MGVSAPILLPMPRPRKYHTPEEAIVAKRLNDLKINKDRHRKWREKYPEKVKLKSAKERAAKLKRIPPWSDLDTIERFYLSCPIGYHVNHIIPLNGEFVSGLHVIENLQYLPSKENLAKGRKFDI